MSPEQRAPPPGRRLALRFGLALPLLGGGLIALFAYAPALQSVREGIVHGTAATAGGLLPLSGWDVERRGHTLHAPGDRAVEVVKDCDGLPVMLLFFAAVLVTPTAWRRKIVFAGIGLGLLFLVNQVRLGHLLYLSSGSPGSFRAAHETWWPAGLLLSAGGLYLLWAARQVPRA